MFDTKSHDFLPTDKIQASWFFFVQVYYKIGTVNL